MSTEAAAAAVHAVKVFERELGGLLASERELADRIAFNVEQVRTMAVTMAALVATSSQQRTNMEGLAAALNRDEGGDRRSVPPFRFTIPDVDADGRLWAALQSGDAAAVAELYGALAAAEIRKC